MAISKLKLERIKRCKTEFQLAHELRVPWPTIRLWENGELKPNAQQKKRLCDIFRVHKKVIFPEKPKSSELPEEPKED
jgi:DNA-binding XRE family transcriptional regulator